MEKGRRSRGGSAFSGIRWASSSQALVAATQLASGIVLFKLLPVEVIGIAAMAHVVTGFAQQLRELGTRMAVVQRPELSREILDSAFLLNVAVGAGLAAAVAAVSPLAVAFYREEALLLPLLALASVFAIGSLGQVHRALLTREMRFAWLGVIDAGAALVQAGVAIALAWRGYGIWSIVLGEIALAGVGSLVAWAARPWRPGLRIRRRALRELLGFGANLMGFNLANYFLQNADRLIIGRVLGADALGLYAFAQRITLFPIRTLGSSVTNVLVPRFALDQDDPQAFARNFARAAAGATLLALPLLGALAVLIAPLVEIYDPKWRHAVWLVVLLCPVGIVQSLTRTLGPALIAKGRPDVLFRIGLMVGGAVLLGSLVGVRFGVVGVAVAFVLTTTLTGLTAFVMSGRPLSVPMRPVLRALASILAAGGLSVAVMTAARLLLEAHGIGPWGVIGVAGGLGALLYWGLVVWLEPPAYHDLRRLLGLRGGARRPASAS